MKCLKTATPIFEVLEQNLDSGENKEQGAYLTDGSPPLKASKDSLPRSKKFLFEGIKFKGQNITLNSIISCHQQ